ncbi:unnamed protein product [Ilex paraguariensis]|uniref:FBD domain-containing protein n=1 Tax=Ilex paraguariensis TaxID=185542 RepID=A0ABC8RPG3_9AQUA
MGESLGLCPQSHLLTQRIRCLRKFMEFVDRVLLLRDSPTIQKFSLTHKRGWWGFHGSLSLNRLNSWICAVTKRHVEQLIVDICLIGVGFLNLPSSLFTCMSLVELQLDELLFTDFPSSVYLPNLSTLKMSFFFYLGNSLNQRFFSGFPMLENLSMRVFSFSDQDMEILIDICAPKLRKLHTFLFANKDKNSPYLNNVKVLIDATILEYLDIEDGCEACYLIKDEPSSLTSAEIDVGPDFFGEADWVPEFFRVFTFCHVTHLVLLSCDDLSKLPEALQRMPKLEFLDVCVVGARKGHILWKWKKIMARVTKITSIRSFIGCSHRYCLVVCYHI